MKEQIITNSLQEARQTLDTFLSDPQTLPTISRMVDLLKQTLDEGGKILSCGNGGSLCDATHFAEELTGRFRADRRPLPAMAINDAAYMTCVGNDFSFGAIFERWVEAFGRKGDLLLALSTSGTSANIVAAAQKAHDLGMKVIGMTACGDTPLSHIADVTLQAPRTAHSDRIQEIHIKVIHIMIEALEQEMHLNHSTHY